MQSFDSQLCPDFEIRKSKKTEEEEEEQQQQDEEL